MLIAAGLVLGLAISMTGVGGGVLTAPLLILWFGLPVETSVGTALLFTTAVKTLCAVLYARRRQVHYRTLALLAAGGVPGALLGPMVLRSVQQHAHDQALVLVGLTVFIAAGFSLVRGLRQSGPLAGARSRPALLVLLSVPIGLEVGFSSAGAGALGSVLLFGATSLSPVQVVGTDLVFGLLVSGCAGAMHLLWGHWASAVLLKLLVGGAVGAIAGSQLAAYCPARPLRTIVLTWASVLGAVLAWQSLGKVMGN
jgi:uncharacterized protein